MYLFLTATLRAVATSGKSMSAVAVAFAIRNTGGYKCTIESHVKSKEVFETHPAELSIITSFKCKPSLSCVLSLDPFQNERGIYAY